MLGELLVNDVGQIACIIFKVFLPEMHQLYPSSVIIVKVAGAQDRDAGAS